MGSLLWNVISHIFNKSSYPILHWVSSAPVLRNVLQMSAKLRRLHKPLTGNFECEVSMSYGSISFDDEIASLSLAQRTIAEIVCQISFHKKLICRQRHKIPLRSQCVLSYATGFGWGISYGIFCDGGQWQFKVHRIATSVRSCSLRNIFCVCRLLNNCVQ